MQDFATLQKKGMLNLPYLPGDRPIRITVERVWNSIGWQAKLRLLRLVTTGLVTKLPTVTNEDVESIDSEDAAEAMTKQLTASFPEAGFQPQSA